MNPFFVPLIADKAPHRETKKERRRKKEEKIARLRESVECERPSDTGSGYISLSWRTKSPHTHMQAGR